MGGVYLVISDESNEFDFALKAAADLASQNKGHVAILKVLEEQDFQPFGGVEARMREEHRREVEQRLQDIALYLNDFRDQVPVYYICEGQSQRGAHFCCSVRSDDQDARIG